MRERVRECVLCMHGMKFEAATVGLLVIYGMWSWYFVLSNTQIYLFFHQENSHKRLIYHHVKVAKGNRNHRTIRPSSLPCIHWYTTFQSSGQLCDIHSQSEQTKHLRYTWSGFGCNVQLNGIFCSFVEMFDSTTATTATENLKMRNEDWRLGIVANTYTNTNRSWRPFIGNCFLGQSAKDFRPLGWYHRRCIEMPECVCKK